MYVFLFTVACIVVYLEKLVWSFNYVIMSKKWRFIYCGIELNLIIINKTGRVKLMKFITK